MLLLVERVRFSVLDLYDNLLTIIIYYIWYMQSWNWGGWGIGLACERTCAQGAFKLKI